MAAGHGFSLDLPETIMLATLLTTLLLAPEAAPPVKLAAIQTAPSTAAAPADASDEEAPVAASAGKICRRSSVQRAGLVTTSRKICRTASEWKAAAAR